jgi:methyltransferase (TIGR00027 family)
MTNSHNLSRLRGFSKSQLAWVICVVGALLLPSALLPIEADSESRTADHVALLRAVAARDPDEKVRNPDDLAEHFVRPYSRKEAVRNNFLMKGKFSQVQPFIQKGLLGAYYYVNARTHHFDAAFLRALDQGIDQFVILGAGHDSRSYRFREELTGVKIFEVDVPGTQTQKQRTLKRKLGGVPEHVTYVAIDFNRQSLADVLPESGYDPAAKTFFLWEGVTYYIKGSAVSATLKFVAENSGAGSSIVFDYLLSRALQRGTENKDSRVVTNRVASWGEPFVFGIDEGAAEAYLSKRGFEVLSDLGAEDLAQRYLVRSDGTIDGPMVDHWRIVNAVVADRAPISGQ